MEGCVMSIALGTCRRAKSRLVSMSKRKKQCLKCFKPGSKFCKSARFIMFHSSALLMRCPKNFTKFMKTRKDGGDVSELQT